MPTRVLMGFLLGLVRQSMLLDSCHEWKSRRARKHIRAAPHILGKESDCYDKKGCPTYPRLGEPQGC